MKALTRKEAQKQLEFLMALEKLDQALDGKTKRSAVLAHPANNLRLGALGHATEAREGSSFTKK